MSFQAGDGWICAPEEAGQRIDKFLGARAPETSRSRIQKWIEEGCFALGGKPARKSDTVAAGDAVDVLKTPEREDLTLKPENIKLNIVYEDAQLLVVDKPKGMVTHPGNGIFQGTLANALAFHYAKLSDVNGPMRPGLLHRLDKDTSGLLVVAKENAAHHHLARQMEAREIKRVYRTLVWREPASPAGRFEGAIARSIKDPLKMTVHPDGKRAVTHYRVLGFFQFASYLEVSLETGRTHQIRVHMSQAGHPVVGDPLYGGRQGYLGRIQPLYQPFAAKLLAFFPSQALHAHQLSFRHPVTSELLQFTSPLPPEMIEALDFLERFKHE